MHYFLGLELRQGYGELFFCQEKYSNEILQIFFMESCKPMNTPLVNNWREEDATIYQQLVGSLMYRVNTRIDMCCAVNQLSQYMVRPNKLFWKVAKHVLGYLRGTTQFGLQYKWIERVKLCSLIYAYLETSPLDQKRTSGGIFSVGSATFSW